MIATGFDRKVKIQQVIQNHLPEFVTADFPKVTEFLKQYYISQEYQGGPVDITDNLDQYLKLDNLTPEVINNSNNKLSYDINSTVGIITVSSSTKGYPSSYGLLKIDDEIITYTGITTNTFTGCIRGFSGITEYNKLSSLGELQFSTSSAKSHSKNATIVNLSSLFLKEFYKKLKYTLTPGLESSNFYSDLNVNNFIKNIRSFYQSKGTEQSIKILFKVLYGEEISVIDLEKYLIKPSSARFNRLETISAELVSGKNPINLIGQTIRKSTDPNTQASVSDVQIFTDKLKTYYNISLFVGYGDQSLIEGDFTIPGKTKVLENTPIGSSIITVDSTIGFPKSGSVICGNNIIKYTDKTINQFLNCSGVREYIPLGSNIRFDEVIYGYENGNLDEKVELRITGSISKLEYDVSPILASKQDKITVKNIGEYIENPESNKTYKELFANSFIYNTSTLYDIKDISGSIFYLKTNIDKSSLKIGDNVDIVLSKDKTIVLSDAVVASVNPANRQISLNNISGFTPSPNQKYSIRRKLKKAYSNTTDLEFGNNKLVSDVQNLYTDSNNFAYLASNSLPSYEIKSKIIFSEISKGYNIDQNNQFLQGYDVEDDTYSIIAFNQGTNFVTGDRVFYFPENNKLEGLIPNESYYVEILESTNKIRLYASRSFIGSTNYTKFKKNINSGYHRFILYKDRSQKISPQKLLKKFPLTQNIFSSSQIPTEPGTVGMFVDGVEISNYKSLDKIYYGPLDFVQVINAGKNFDVINPPKLIVDNPLVSGGTTALVSPVITGSVTDVFVDPQDFEIDKIISLTITGGNGTGAVLSPVLDLRFRELTFDARGIFDGGGLDIENEAIAFEDQHRLKNGEEVYYSNNGNPSIGIGPFNGTNVSQNKFLANGARYYVKVLNTRSIQLYPNLNSFNLGINTVGFTTVNNGGLHKFRTKSKNILKSIKVVNPGSGYENRQLYVNYSGINTFFNVIEYKNHNLKSGDVVEYYSSDQIISGLSTLSSYLVTKIDDDSFKLSDAGIGASITSNYERGKYVSLNSTGSGYHIFKYPPIKVNISVSYANTSFANEKITLTPVVKGSIKEVYLYEKGSGYGSKILNTQRSPSIKVFGGEGAEVRPVVKDGKIVKVNVLYSGADYHSVPDLVVNGDGIGCILRAVVVNKKLKEVVVINSGGGYKQTTTTIDIVSSGTGAIFNTKIRSLTINNQKRFGSRLLSETDNNNLKYSILSYDNQLFDYFGENSTKHSEIIGWAYDGNPIYGPYGYTEPGDFNTPIKRIESGYSLSLSNVFDRPTGFELGFFTEDYKFTNSGDLDIYNGRFCKTPNFPDGVYAYFATTIPDTLTQNLTGYYPFFVGDYYRSDFIQENRTLDQYYDFNSSKLIRNTFPYKVNDPYGGSEFLLESNEFVNQITEVEDISKGFVDGLNILNPGQDYKIGDSCVFESSNGNGGGLRAIVSEVEGIDITDITTSTLSYDNVTLSWYENNIVIRYSPYHELKNADYVNISGLTTSISGLKRVNTIGVKTETATLLSSMALNTVPGYVQDIVITPIPRSIKVDSQIKIETEILTVLNIFEDQSIIRVKRADVGFAHTAPLEFNVLQNEFLLNARTKFFDSKINDKIYFNPIQSVGIGTTPGVGINRSYIVGNVINPITVQTQSIYIPNHPFKNGQEAILRKKPGGPSLVVANSPNSQSFNLPPADSSFQKVYIINKSKDFIGLVTGISSVSNTNGLFLLEPIPNENEFSIESNFNQVKGKVSKINSRVSVSTYHNLLSGDLIKLELKPKTSVGIGNSNIVRVLFNKNYNRLLINTIGFSSTSVNIVDSKITIQNHQLKNGDRIFYDCNDLIISGLSTGEYYAHVLDSNNLQLSETYKDSLAYPPKVVKFSSIGGNLHQISLVTPNISVPKNSTLVFDVSNTSLSGYKFKFYSDSNFTKEYYGTPERQSVIGIGTIGDGSSALINLKYNKNYSQDLFYSLEKNGRVLKLDDIQTEYNNSRISFVDSIYNGSYSIFGVGSTTFNINLIDFPERNNYSQGACDVLKYSTNSTRAMGGIKKLNILNPGYGYDYLPELKKINTKYGKNALIVPKSSNIGNISKYRIINQGFEYFSDKTLRPEAYIYPVILLKNSNTLESIDILDPGSGYASPPNLLVRNSQTKQIVDEGSVSCKTPYGSVNEVSIDAPVYGLSSAEHELICIDNSNGVGIVSITTSKSGGIATCVLITPVINGFLNPPFAVGDEIFVENIVNQGEGTGYNSSNYNYEFFKVTSYENTNPAVLEFNVSGFSSNPGIAKPYQSGYATIVNKNKYPKFKLNQNFGKFIKGESLLIKGDGGFVEHDLYVEESKKDYIKVSGYYVYALKTDDIIKGKESGVLASVSSLIPNNAKFEVNYSNSVVDGWTSDTGKMNETHQVIEDNDYYQNLSYTIKSNINYEKFIDPVNRLVHVSGLKNFGDLQVESKTKLISVGSTSRDQIILDIFNEKRVDTINNYLFVTDYDTFTGSGGVKKSKYLKVNKSLTDYIKCISNRVLPIDDISKKFASKDNERDLFTDIYEFIDSDDYSKYLIQVIDPLSKKYSLIELIVFIINKDIYTFERSSLSNFSGKLGDFSGVLDDFDNKKLRFYPADPYNTDYDIKFIQSSFGKIISQSKVGINTLSVGCIDLMGKYSEVGIGSTSTLLKLPKNYIKGFVADLYLFDTVKFDTNIVEVVVDHDGQNTFLSEYYVDNQVGVSTNYFGTFEAKIGPDDYLYFNFTNNLNTKVSINGRIVGFGRTELGIGTSRFLFPGQPAGSERSARYQSNYTHNVGISTVLELNVNLESSVKSLVRVSYGNTTAIHQVICVQNEEDIYTEQYPFLSVGNNTGIGTFGGEYNGTKFLLKFYPDDSVTDKVLVQSYNEIIYTFSDYDNEALGISGANEITFDHVIENVKLSAYDGINGLRANRLEFDAKYSNFPIFKKTFNPSDTIDYENNLLKIKNHFFSTGEKLIYKPVSTFVGVGQSSIGIGQTTNSSGFLTNVLPSDVYAIRINEDQIRLSTTRESALSGIYVTFTSPGEGNAHELEMTKKLEKSVISIDGIVQKPLSYTGIKYKLVNNYGQISAATSYFSMSGISTIKPTDLLKVDDEFMLVTSVGIGTTNIGPITAGIGTLQLVNVKRGFAGTISSTHTDFTDAIVYRGSFNIVGSKIYFTQPPRGSARNIRDLSNLPYPTSSFGGRVFLRQDYTTNTLYDDISDKFTGIDQYYRLSVQGINTTGIETGSGVVFINGVFQTPSTENNQNNNYRLEQNAGISSVVFTGITSTNGMVINSEYDINQNLLPRGGLVVSLGSTQGLGFAPLVGASVTAVINPSTGSIISVGLGSTDVFGSGYNHVVSIGVTDANHTGAAATITATVGVGGTLAFNVVYGGTGYVNPVISVPDPSYENLPIIGVSRRGIGNTTESGKNMLLSIEVGPNSRKIPGKNADAANLIDSNKQLIAEVAVGRMLAAYPSFTIPGGNQNCIDDVIDVLESITYNLRYSGNDKVYDAAKIYVDNPILLSGEQTESIYVYEQVKSLAIQAMRNETININGYSSLTQHKDNTVIGDVSGVPGVYGPSDCVDVSSAIGSFVGIVTNAIAYSTLPTKTVAEGSLYEVKSFKIERSGYGFQLGDVFKPVGLVTDRGLVSPLSEFELTVTEVFSDTFASWQFGELDYIDSIKNLQDGVRKRFPLYYKGQLLSFEKDLANSQYPNIDLDQVLVIFVNGVIQQPKVAYTFEGGSSFLFQEAPIKEANIAIFFYRGTREVDTLFVDINETLKIGDSVQVRKLNTIESTRDQELRRIEDFSGSDLVQTNIYTGFGIDENNERPLDWIKQKRDLTINGELVYKTRDSLESQVYPTAKIIKNFAITDDKLFVDDAEFFNYEENNYGVIIDKYNGLVVHSDDPVSASVTAIVSNDGSISSLDIVSPGVGYTDGNVQIKISAPNKIGVGIGTTALAIGTASNGSLIGPITILDPGFGYNKDNPPQVITVLPDINTDLLQFERQSQFVPIARGFSGIVTGITTTTGTNGNPLALKFFVRRSPTSATFDDLEVGYPIYIYDTAVGSGLTSIDSENSSTVGIGTQFVNNIYYVHNIIRLGPEAIITSNIHSSTNVSGIQTSSNFLNPIGKFSWGILSKVKGGSVAIAVTGLTVDSGLSTFPTIQRRKYGLRDTGSVRKLFT